MIIDSDTHINEPLRLYETFLEEPYRSAGRAGSETRSDSRGSS